MSTPAQKRLIRDLHKIEKEENSGITASIIDNDLLKWEALIEGPEGTIWEDGLFKLHLQFSQQYPNKAPEVKFTSEMFHPNIYTHGGICLDMLQNQWCPSYDVWAVLTSIRSLLSDPNILSPANPQAAKIYNENRSQYERRVREIVDKSYQQ